MAANDISLQAYGDYVQSANTLFNFMTEFGFLQNILYKKAIVPRYCIENMDYLNVKLGAKKFTDIAILQKCFCDIPLHKLAETFNVSGTGDSFNSLSIEDKFKIQHNNTHFDFYGKFAIGFSKQWSEQKRLQPIHYLNIESTFIEQFKQVLNEALNSDELPDVYSDDIVQRLAFIKPLRGLMQRKFRQQDGSDISVEIQKNFHDECEWRYVPDSATLSAVQLESIIANTNIIENFELREKINKSLETEQYSSLWLRFEYDDIRYIIVPDNYYRIKLIQAIKKIPNQMFSKTKNISLQKQIMISKILVLEEIRRDWWNEQQTQGYFF